MDTNSLYYFAEAAKDMNFTKTAKRLFISQQNLSNHIMRLEAYYDTKLFERKPHLSLTYSGEVLLTYATNFKIDEDNLKNVLTDIKEKERGVLKIGCSPMRTSIVMPQLAVRFAQKYPNVELEFYHYHSDRLTDMLLSGELDMAVTVDRFEHPSLLSTYLFTDTIYISVSKTLLIQHFGKEHAGELIRKANKNGADLKDFSSLPFVNVRLTNIIRDCFKDQHCEPNFIITTDIPRFSLSDFYQEIAASIITRTVYLIMKDRVDKDILFFPLNTTKDLSLHNLAFVRHRKKYLSRYGQYFLDTTVQFFQELDEN